VHSKEKVFVSSIPAMSRKSFYNFWNGLTAANKMELQPLQSDVESRHSTLTDHNEPRILLSKETGSTVATFSDSDEEVHHDLTKAGTKRRGFVRDFFFPPDLPEEVQLLRWENLGIPVCYLVVGILQGLFRTLLNVYPLGLGATEAQQTTFTTIATIPAAFKIIYGFTTDNLPIMGYRRKPYIFLGWFCVSSLMLLLSLTSDLTLIWDAETGKPVPPPNAPSLTWLSIAFFLFGISMWFADATADALVAEKARCEPEERRGALQSTCYACRFFGLMCSAPMSNYLYTHLGPQMVIHLLMLVPTIMFPLSYLLEERKDIPINSLQSQCTEIWTTVCSRSVWQPMGFIYLFNLFQIPNAAWRQYLRTVLHFSDGELNDLLVASYVLLYVGTITYKFCFLTVSWRRVYLGCILLNALFSSMQLLLIRGYTFGLSPFIFALGDDSMAEFIQGIQFLPSTILMVALTPAGSEGAAYAMFTTMWNSAMMIAPALSSVLLGIWNTSETALLEGNLEGLFNLSVLTTLLQIAPIVFLCWMPHNRDHLYALSEKAGSGHALGGAIFLTVLGASMMWIFTVAVLNILNPGWAGAS
jgi:MFS family permease